MTSPIFKAIKDFANELSTTQRVLTVDDLRAYADDMGFEIDPAQWGAFFRGKQWKRVSMAPSRYPSNRGRMVSVWTRSNAQWAAL